MTEDTPAAQDGCPFCSPPPERNLLQTAQVIGLWDAYAVSPGHALLIPRRHVATWFDATPAEKLALIEAIDVAKVRIEALHSPDGYNIGINSGEAAGQTVFHLHVHVIPRYRGDVTDPRGGVRHVIPGKGNYLSDGVADMAAIYRIDQPQLLVSGGDDPLRPHLARHLAQSRADQRRGGDARLQATADRDQRRIARLGSRDNGGRHPGQRDGLGESEPLRRELDAWGHLPSPDGHERAADRGSQRQFEGLPRQRAVPDDCQPQRRHQRPHG